MKKLLVMCGSGIATSTVVMGKLKEWLQENGYETNVQLFQSKISEEINRIDEYDIVLSTTVVPENIKDKVIMALPLLTGIGTEAFWEKIKKALTA